MTEEILDMNAKGIGKIAGTALEKLILFWWIVCLIPTLGGALGAKQFAVDIKGIVLIPLLASVSAMYLL